MTSPYVALVARWRAEADAYATDGADAHAKVLRRAADDLVAVIEGWAREPLPLPVAAEVSGYSVAHLRRLLGVHALENVGTPRAPLVRQGDLPRKPRPRTVDGPDLAGPVLARRGLALTASRR